MLHGGLSRLDIIMGDCEGVMPDRVEYDNASTVERELVCPVRGGGLLLSPTPNRLLKGCTYIQNVANTTLRGHENTKVIYTSGRVKWRTQ